MQIRKSTLLVVIQFSSIGIFALRAKGLPSAGFPWLCFVLGLLLVIWAILVMNPLKTTVFPEPKSGTNLLTNGPYRWIRHPMYTAVLLICFSWMWSSGTWIDVLLFIVLVANQWIKLSYEESLLTKMFPKEYPNYKRNSKALIPFVL